MDTNSKVKGSYIYLNHKNYKIEIYVTKNYRDNQENISGTNIQKQL